VEKPTVSGSELPTVAGTVPRGPPDDREGPVGGSPPRHEGKPAARRGEAPLVLHRYRLHRQLGAGGFGTVWLARDERLDRDVAVKIVPRQRVMEGRFEREARAAARLSHPGIVTLYEAGADDDGAYLVSEVVRGATFGELLSAGRLSDRDIVQIGIALCDALAHAHSQGVVHRDVKPSNILIPEQPASAVQVVKLTDFGVARVVGGDSLTRTGDVVGTAAYMAPEQAEGMEVTAAADLYALALVLYEALTGVNPVRASTAASRARRLGAHLPPLRRQRRDLSRELGQGIDLALRPRPRERGRLEDLRAALTAALPATHDEPGVVAASWKPATRAERRADRPSSTPAWADRALQPWADRAPQPWADRAPGPPEDTDPGTPADAPPTRPTIGARALAAVAAALTTGWLLAHVMDPWPIAPAAVAVLAGALVAALPRVGWLILTATLSASLLLEQRAGGALVLAVGGLLPVALLPTAASAWPLSGGAPFLGAIGLAGAWPALAARASSVWLRAALGVTGWLWLLLAAPLAGTSLFFGRAPGTPSPAVWTGSLHETIHHVLVPLLNGGALAPAPVWALAAVTLPWAVHGRSLRRDLARVTVWAASLIVATALALELVHGALAHGVLWAAVIGAVAGAGVAIAPSAATRVRNGAKRRPSPDPRGGSPGLA
jgi:serine/threonine protein kinase